MKFTRIALDAGHNAPPDTGAFGNGILEDRVTKAVAERLGELIAQNRLAQLVMVNPNRADNVGDSLRQRVSNANGMNANLYVSIHCNAASNSNARGTEVFYFPKNTDGRDLALLVSDSISKALGLPNRGAKEGNFYVLRHTNCTAILIEIGFVTNAKDAAELTRTNDIAKSIYDALVKFQNTDAIDTTRMIPKALPKAMKPDHAPLEPEEDTDQFDYAALINYGCCDIEPAKVEVVEE